MCSTRNGTYKGCRAAKGPVTSVKMAAILGTILDFPTNKELSRNVKVNLTPQYFFAKINLCTCSKSIAPF